MFDAKILLDSISENGKRLTTFEITFPRIVLSEFNTHRMLSRNSASSRAIPFKKQLERVEANPFIPEKFPVNGKGMQPGSYFEQGTSDYELAKARWLKARDRAVISASELYHQDWNASDDEGRYVHKQIVNRLLEPFMWHTVICTATEFDNFFKLRTHPDAQHEIKRIADLMYEAYHYGICPDGLTGCEVLHGIKPKLLKQGEWHLPLVYDEDISHVSHFLGYGDYCLTPRHLISSTLKIAQEFLEVLKKISVARCARVSYLTHDGKRDIIKDIELFDRLVSSGHWSPVEHVATPLENMLEWSGNFQGWKQLRKEYPNENCTHFSKT